MRTVKCHNCGAKADVRYGSRMTEVPNVMGLTDRVKVPWRLMDCPACSRREERLGPAGPVERTTRVLRSGVPGSVAPMWAELRACLKRGPTVMEYEEYASAGVKERLLNVASVPTMVTVFRDGLTQPFVFGSIDEMLETLSFGLVGVKAVRNVKGDDDEGA